MANRPPSLRAIAAFEAAARHRSFARAADELNLTTSAISHAIKGLENRLATRLFERSGRRVSLTAEGQALAVKVRVSLALLGDAFDIQSPGGTRRLRVTTLPSIASRLGPAWAGFADRFPDVSLTIDCSPLLADVGEGADVAIRFGPGGWAGLQSQKLADEQLFPVAASSHPGSSLDSMTQLPLIMQPENTWRLWFDGAGIEAGRFAGQMDIDDHRVALDAAAAGAGIALARAWLVQPWLKSGRLARIDDRAVGAEYSYWAVWDGSSSKRQLIGEFVDWIAPRFAD